MRRPVQWRAPQQIDHRCFAGLNLRGCFGRLVFRRDDQIDIDPERVEVDIGYEFRSGRILNELRQLRARGAVSGSRQKRDDEPVTFGTLADFGQALLDRECHQDLFHRGSPQDEMLSRTCWSSCTARKRSQSPEVPRTGSPSATLAGEVSGATHGEIRRAGSCPRCT